METFTQTLADFCLGCGDPLPEALERYTLGEGRAYCPKCGMEVELTEEEAGDD